MKVAFATRAREMALTATAATDIGGSFIFFQIPNRSRPVEPDLIGKVSRIGRSEFFAFRQRMLRSFVAQAVARELFAIGRPPASEILASVAHAAFPALTGHFHIGQQTPAASIGPLKDLFGPHGRGQAAVAVGAMAEALLSNIESVRAVVESVVLDSLEDNAEMMTKVSEIEERLLAWAPPLLPAASPEESQDWIARLLTLVDGWASPECSWI
jgi:hypothetical protein